jgi:two-component sensor histidine kinase
MPKNKLDDIYDLVCRISGVKSIAENKNDAIIAGLMVIEKKLTEKNKLQKENENRVDGILEVIMALAQLNYSKKAKISNKTDHLDAIALGINMLGEELQSSTISLHEKEVLLKEIHHRVKNNLQVISSLLSLQSENITDSYSLEKFKESQNRVRSMALVHEKLYESKDFSKISFSEYIEAFIEAVNRSYNISEGRVKLHVNTDIGKSYFDLNIAIPCALILNELVSNAFKYAFPNQREGNLYLNFNRSNEDDYLIEVRDDGIGIPSDIDTKTTSSLGLQLVDMLIEQINGTVNVKSENGTTFTIRFKIK